MVSTTIPEKSCLPDGRFRLVGWDVDSTGQMVTDEICQLAAYTPKEDFSQYIMPYKDLNKFAQRRYMLYTKTIGRYRALTDRTNNKTIRTKSEISALVDFLMWLEKIKNQEPACTGLILLCHDAFELAPLLLIQALKRYDLLDRFSSIVKGFGNCYAFVKFKCESSVTSFSLKTLSKILLDKDSEQIYSARNRARIAYQLVQHLRAGLVERPAMGGGGDGGDGSTVLSGELGELSEFTMSVAAKESSLPGKLVQLERQYALLPLFRTNERQRMNLHERRRVTQLRSQLLDTMIDYETLRKTWTEGNKEKLVGVLECALSQSNEEDRQELVKIAVRHFECPPERPKGRRRGSSKSMTLSETSAPQTPTSSSSPSNSNSNGIITPPPAASNGHLNGTSIQSAINSTTSE